MIKPVAVLELVIGERSYQLQCHSNSPLGELHDALMQMKGYVVERMQKAHAEEHQISEAKKAQDMAEEQKQEVSCSEA